MENMITHKGKKVYFPLSLLTFSPFRPNFFNVGLKAMKSQKSLVATVPLKDMADVQNHVSPHTIDIDKVGVKDISNPIVVLDK